MPSASSRARGCALRVGTVELAGESFTATVPTNSWTGASLDASTGLVTLHPTTDGRANFIESNQAASGGKNVG